MTPSELSPLGGSKFDVADFVPGSDIVFQPADVARIFLRVLIASLLNCYATPLNAGRQPGCIHYAQSGSPAAVANG
jgi:hypothetical protein